MTTLTLVSYADAALVAHDLSLHHGVSFKVERNCWSDEIHDLWDVCGPDGFIFQPPLWYSEPNPGLLTKWETLMDGLSTNDSV